LVRGRTLLKITGITKYFPVRSGFLQRQTGTVMAVDGVDLEVQAGGKVGAAGRGGRRKRQTRREHGAKPQKNAPHRLGYGSHGYG